jgi:hypothetical protein
VRRIINTDNTALGRRGLEQDFARRAKGEGEASIAVVHTDSQVGGSPVQSGPASPPVQSTRTPADRSYFQTFKVYWPLYRGEQPVVFAKRAGWLH